MHRRAAGCGAAGCGQRARGGGHGRLEEAASARQLEAASGQPRAGPPAALAQHHQHLTRASRTSPSLSNVILRDGGRRFKPCGRAAGHAHAQILPRGCETMLRRLLLESGAMPRSCARTTFSGGVRTMWKLEDGCPPEHPGLRHLPLYVAFLQPLLFNCSLAVAFVRTTHELVRT